ncbi:mobile element protein [Aquipluma nitroreducens]|uniref:Mobile element protein n=1 Tax=Aquipluma nitroreducens TaxID=2010828 RepID=A0A5K7S4Q2_9BACT|nr:mobile element protein [Aquipluma nitroreducens]
MGLLLAFIIHAACVHDSKGESDLIALLKSRFERLVKIVADDSYRRELIEKTKTTFSSIL